MSDSNFKERIAQFFTIILYIIVKHIVNVLHNFLQLYYIFYNLLQYYFCVIR